MQNNQNNFKTTSWKKSNSDIFWGEIAPCDHLIQIYETDAIFLKTLIGFVSAGLNEGDSVIIVATYTHIEALNASLLSYGINIASLIEQDRYVTIDVETGLSKFMVDGWPDEKLFVDFVLGLISRTKKKNKNIRVFGEMVALLWGQGHTTATIQLERLWHQFCQKSALSVFCAYPKAGFTKDIDESVTHICNSHSKVIVGSEMEHTEILYRNI